jgi:transformation/transcription domain-associated protein
LGSINNILRTEKPGFTKDSPECQLRQTLLQILNRTPHTESFKELAPGVVDLLLFLISNDNEDVGALAVKFILELSRNLRTTTESQASAFIQLVEKMYGNMEQLVEEEFTVTDVSQISNRHKHSMKSFKVLGECPILIVLFMQLHRSLVNQTVRSMLPVLMSVSRVALN